MPDLRYVLAVLATVFAITFALRALPFAALKPLRQSHLVAAMAAWMPAGILLILAAATFDGVVAEDSRVLPAVIAVAVTVGVHLGAGRRTLLSVGAGTMTYVGLLAMW